MFTVHCNGFRICRSLFGLRAVVVYLLYSNKGYTVLRFCNIVLLHN